MSKKVIIKRVSTTVVKRIVIETTTVEHIEDKSKEIKAIKSQLTQELKQWLKRR